VTRLADLEPPSERTPGYHADPLGGNYPRWWDGESWRNQVGPSAHQAAANRKRVGRAVRDYGPITGVVIALSFGPEVDIPAKVAIAFGAGGVAYGLALLFLRIFPDFRPDPE